MALFRLFIPLLCFFCFAQLDAASLRSLSTETVDVRMKKARDVFNRIYRELVKKEHFPAAYQNNLVFDSSLRRDPARDTQIILRLIYWLEQQDDAASAALLHALNDIFCLELNGLIGSLDLKQDPGPKILSHFQDLERYTMIDNEQELYPFRPSLSKIALIIIYVNGLSLGYETRKETIQELLAHVKAEMIKINAQLPNKLDEKILKDFVTFIGIYMVREPLVKTNTAKKYVLGTIAAGSCAYAITKLLKLDDPDVRSRYAERGWESVSNFVEKLSYNILRHIGKGLSLGINEGMGLNPRIDALEQRLDRVIDLAEKETARLHDDVLPKVIERMDRVVDIAEGLQGETIPQALETIDGVRTTVNTALPNVLTKIGELQTQVDGLPTNIATAARPVGHNLVTGAVTGAASGILELTGLPAAYRWAMRSSNQPAQQAAQVPPA